MKKKSLGWFFLGDSINQPLSTHSFLINKLANNFEKLFIINFKYLNLLLNERKLSLAEFEDTPNDKFFLEKNIEIKNFKSKEDFVFFIKNRKMNLLYTNNFGTNLPSIKLLRFLNNFDINFFEINDISNIDIPQKIELKYFFKGIKFKFENFIYKFNKFILFNLKKIHKNQIKFTSKEKNFKIFGSSKIFKLLSDKNLFFSKKIIRINSKAFDLLYNEKYDISENKIVLLDDHFGHPSSLKIRGEIKKDNIEEHYKNLNELLKNLEKKYNKEIVICIHPKDDIELKKKIFSDYKVFKYQTRENIFDAYIVLFFETTAILDAILLKKNIISIYSQFMDESVKNASNYFKKKIGITQIKLVEDNLIFKKDLERKFLNSKKKFDNFINEYIAIDDKNLGFKKIISQIENYMK